MKNWFGSGSTVVHIMKHWVLKTICAFPPWSLWSRNHHPLSSEYIMLISPVWECYGSLSSLFSHGEVQICCPNIQCPNMKIRISILLNRKIYCVHKSITFRWCEVFFTSLCSKLFFQRVMQQYFNGAMQKTWRNIKLTSKQWP